MSEAHESLRSWKGETGLIRREMLERHISDLKDAVYYFAGPPAMVVAMHDMLEGIGITEPAMRYEEFYGY